MLLGDADLLELGHVARLPEHVPLQRMPGKPQELVGPCQLTGGITQRTSRTGARAGRSRGNALDEPLQLAGVLPPRDGVGDHTQAVAEEAPIAFTLTLTVADEPTAILVAEP